MALALLLLAWGFAQFVLAYRWGHQELDDALANPQVRRYQRTTIGSSS